MYSDETENTEDNEEERIVMDMPAIAMESDSEGEENIGDGERDLPPNEEDETYEDVEVNLHYSMQLDYL